MPVAGEPGTSFATTILTDIYGSGNKQLAGTLKVGMDWRLSASELLTTVAGTLVDEDASESALRDISAAAARLCAERSSPPLSNLAGALLRLGRVADARKQYKRAHGINAKALGEEHESTLEVAKGLQACDAAAPKKKKKAAAAAAAAG